MQRHMLAGTFFSIGLNDQDVRFSLLGNKQTDELEFSVSIPEILFTKLREQYYETEIVVKFARVSPPQVMV